MRALVCFAAALETFDVAVGFKWGQNNIDGPKWEEQTGGGDLPLARTSEFAADERSPTDKHDAYGDKGAHAKYGDGER